MSEIPEECDFLRDEDIQLLSDSVQDKKASDLAKAILSIANLKLFVKHYLVAEGEMCTVKTDQATAAPPENEVLVTEVTGRLHPSLLNLLIDNIPYAALCLYL